MHWDDAQIARIAAILGVAKLLKELLWTKTSRRIGASLFKKIKSVPRGIRKPSKKTSPIHIFWLHAILENVSSIFLLQRLFFKKSLKSGLDRKQVIVIPGNHDVDIVFSCVDKDHINPSNLNRLFKYYI